MMSRSPESNVRERTSLMKEETVASAGIVTISAPLEERIFIRISMGGSSGKQKKELQFLTTIFLAGRACMDSEFDSELAAGLER